MVVFKDKVKCLNITQTKVDKSMERRTESGSHKQRLVKLNMYAQTCERLDKFLKGGMYDFQSYLAVNISRRSVFLMDVAVVALKLSQNNLQRTWA